MKYRKFGSTGLEVSALGFGAMRLPTSMTEGDRFSDRIVVPEAIRMIRHSIDQGVNYIDTAYPYHGGKSEIVTGKALKDGYREKVLLATKLPVWSVRKAEDFDRLLDEQLGKLQTDYIDCYLLHSLSRHSWRNTVLKHNLLEKAEAAKKAGKIRHIGFSFHDGPDAFREIVDGYDKWEFCQIQYNYMDMNNQAGMAGLKYAASKGLAVVIMEPLLGGRLANPPKEVLDIFKASGKGASAADWALQWLWNQPEVSTVLSGMSNMEQLEENLISAARSGVGIMSEEDLGIIEKARLAYQGRAIIPCTRCGYCMPCPNKVDIPRNFELYNESVIYDDPAGSQNSYKHFFDPKARAGKCIACKVCEPKCPQGIPISEWMPKVHKALSGE
jgi:predicted aldo/keto reductase-like oxidoreductase